MAGAWPTDIHKAKLIQCLEARAHDSKNAEGKSCTGGALLKQTVFDWLSSDPVFLKLEDCEDKAVSKRKVSA